MTVKNRAREVFNYAKYLHPENNPFSQIQHALEKATEMIAKEGYASIASDTISEAFDISKEELGSLAKYWNDLPTDDYLHDEGRYRKRKIGHVHIDIENNQFSVSDNQMFYQSKSINSANGGVKRFFDTVPNSFYHEPAFQKLLLGNLRVISDVGLRRVNVSFHLFRVISRPDEVGQATPEGIHRDGHLYVGQHLIRRENVSGGISGIYTPEKESLFNTTLTAPLDSIVVNDEKVMHDVSEVYCADNRCTGYRDMLVIDYNRDD